MKNPLKRFDPIRIYKKRKKIIPYTVEYIHEYMDRFYAFAADKGIFLRSFEKELFTLKNHAKDDSCFIVGNGPSLNPSDLEAIQKLGIPSFAFNKIYLLFKETQYKPSYYMVQDPLVFNQNLSQIQNVEDCIRFFPTRFSKSIPSKNNTYFYPYSHDYSWFPNLPNINLDPLPIQCGSSVSHAAIQLAVFFGYKNIYLLGVDFSYSVPKKRSNENDDIAIYSGEQNYFHADYRNAEEEWFIPRLEHQKLAYQAIKEKAEIQGINIINATRGGNLDVFPRQDMDEILSSLKTKK